MENDERRAENPEAEFIIRREREGGGEGEGGRQGDVRWSGKCERQ